MTKYTHNPVKTDPGTDINTLLASDDGATHTYIGSVCLLEVMHIYAQNLCLIWSYFHPTLRQKKDVCTFTSVSYED